jgi:hypothetical protein
MTVAETSFTMVVTIAVKNVSRKLENKTMTYLEAYHACHITVNLHRGQKDLAGLENGYSWIESHGTFECEKWACNQLAPLQTPPRAVLKFSEVASYVWLGEFELLKDSWQEILVKPWVSKANREIAGKYFKIIRAREEIACLTLKFPAFRNGSMMKTFTSPQLRCYSSKLC